MALQLQLQFQLRSPPTCLSPPSPSPSLLSNSNSRPDPIPFLLPLAKAKTLTLTSSRKLMRPTLRPAGANPTNAPLNLKEDEEEEESDVKESVAVLKEAAKTRRVPASDVLTALSKIKKLKVDPTAFFETLGGTETPGRTWMLIFTAQGRLEKGQYFPLTAVQRFNAAAKRIENGVYLGPVGNLTFEGRLSWKNRKLAFIFECVRIKIGPFGPLQIDFKNQDQREPGTKDPFFIWFYVDEEIAVAQGRGGGVAFWCRCRRVTL